MRRQSSYLHLYLHLQNAKQTIVLDRIIGNLSFRTQVISYPSHFVPFWSFCTHFYFQFSHFVPSLVISYLLLLFSRKPFCSFRTYFLLFRTQVISYPKSFRTHFNHFVPGSFRTRFQTRYELTWVRNDFFFCCNLLLPD